MQPFPAEPAETIYAITVDANNEAAERWFTQADEVDLTRTLASARDLARDLGVPAARRLGACGAQAAPARRCGMTDRDRSRWCWDRVWIGCGKSKAPTRSTAGEMYTGSLFASHRAIIDHLGLSLFEPEILSAKHGVIPWTTTIDPYEAELDADARKRLDFAALVEAERLIDEALRGRGRLADPDQQSWARVGSAFGPPIQPSILVLAGASYLEGWVARAEALGVRVDAPLAGMTLGARRSFARRFVAETPSWRDVTWEEEIAGGWGSRREQLISFAEALDLELVMEGLPSLILPTGAHV